MDLVVQGHVRQANGRTCGGVRVIAVDKDLRHEQILGESITDRCGCYEIRYSIRQFRRSEKGSADLIVRALSEEGSMLAASAILFNAPSPATVDLIIDNAQRWGPAEFERYLTELEPVLEGAALADLTEEEMRFLAGETAIAQEHIRLLAIAYQHMERTDIGAEPLYGLFREAMPTDLQALLAQSPQALREALQRAVDAHIISDQWREAQDRIIEQISHLRTEYIFRSPDRVEAASLGRLVGTVLKAPEQQSLFLARYLQHQGPAEAFWDALHKEPNLRPHVAELQTVMQIGTLTGFHPPLAQALRSMMQTGKIGSLRDLAHFDAGDWKKLITKPTKGDRIGVPAEIPGATDEERATNYARVLERMVEEAYPTATIASRLQRDRTAGDHDVARFLTANPDFDLSTVYLDHYLQQNPGALHGVQDRDATARRLKAMQRVFKVAPRYQHMRRLMDDQLDSAHRIARMGQSAFEAKYGPQFGFATSRKIYENAAQVSALSLHLLALVSPGLNGVEMPALPGLKESVDGVPNLETLFGSFDLCACQHCRSVLSPAAYLVDILHFLKDRPSTIAGRSVRDILFARRPDIGEIELTCANTNTPLPYIDLVCEVLEQTVSPIVQPAEWAALPLPAAKHERFQTRGTADEVRVNPEHIDAAAYTKLRTEVYPWSLPFDLWTAEADTYLNHLGVARAELMKRLQRVEGGMNPTDLEIATAYLGLTITEQKIITGQPLTPPRAAHEFWGYSAGGAGWFDPLRSVKTFLQKSGLRYDELVELLRLTFINPNGLMRIESSDPADPETCDTAKLVITNLTAPALDRIHRFIRLARRLGWSLRAVDQACVALHAADLTPDLLMQLAHIQQLQRDLSVPVVTLLSWYAPIDTVRYNDPPDERQKSLYEELFLAPGIVAADEVNPFELNLAGTEVAVASTFSDQSVAAALLGALGISAADLALLTSGPQAVVGNAVNLLHLSRLYRHVTLARALQLSLAELLTVRALTGIYPFVKDGPPVSGAVIPISIADSRDTLQFVESVAQIRASGFRIDELAYLLKGSVDPVSGVGPAPESLAQLLQEVRTGLQKIAAETAVVPDVTGELTRKYLARLAWSNPLIEQAVAIVGGTALFVAPLAALPGGIVVPLALAAKMTYDGATGTLRLRGPMTQAERTSLLALSADAAYQAAIQDLFDQPRRFVTQQMKAFAWPTFAAPLAVLPMGIAFPAELKGRVYYDAVGHQLRFTGVMSEAERQRLSDLAPVTEVAYQGAIGALYGAPVAYTPETRNQFLSPSDAAALFDLPATPEQRFALVLGRLLGYLRNTLSESLVKQRLSEALKLEVGLIDRLLTQWIASPAHPAQKAMADFLAPSFAESNPGLAVTEASFPDLFGTCTLLHKAALLISRLKMTTVQLSWLFTYGPAVGWLDLNNLAGATFTAWARLVDLLWLRDNLPKGEATLAEMFSLARTVGVTRTDLLARLSETTRWSVTDLTALADALGFIAPVAFQDERPLLRLQTCMALLKRLGVSAAQCLAWRTAEMTAEGARSARQAAQAKYEASEWPAVAGPLCDLLREQKRDALVAYLVAHPNGMIADPARRQTWTDVNGLYEHLLIDVEMSACQMTSRIKQAISAVQLFVQRCLMNLEPYVQPKGDIKWREWKWMKNYRVWEANRKIFLYPENWIEPELRDDKSPFFKEMENELQQGEVTQETAESAFLHYLEKLDAVSRLEVCGLYHQEEFDKAGNKAVDLLHVFARTHSTPHAFYYRRRVDESYWTAWEKVDLDIEGDQLIPVVYNRRLYLFWGVFTQETEQQSKGESVSVEVKLNQTLTEPNKTWKIQLAWSEYKQGKWLAKRVSPTHLISYLTQKRVHTFKALFDGDALVIMCLQNIAGNCMIGEFRFTGCSGQPLTQQLQHPSNGVYYMLEPKRTDVESAGFVEESPTPSLGSGADDGLIVMTCKLPAGSSYGDIVGRTVNYDFMINTSVEIETLKKTPGRFRLITPHQYAQFIVQDPFFFQDYTRAFFVVPQEISIFTGWKQPAKTLPGLAGKIFDHYKDIVLQPETLIPDPIGPVIDPPIFEMTFTKFNQSMVKGVEAIAHTDAAPSPMFAKRMALHGATVKESSDYLFWLARAVGSIKQLWFYPFYHPHVCLFIHELNRDGIDGLLQRQIQIAPHTFMKQPQPFSFKAVYDPTVVVPKPYPKEDVDFTAGGAYSQYNWELFFHTPLMLAQRLSKNQRFEEAQRWFHYIFDPTDTSGYSAPQKYWRTRPFFETTTDDYRKQQIDRLLQMLAEGASDPDLISQVQQWRRNPFHPHVVARLRTTAYQKTVIMKYLDNLIAWGDQLFSRDTLESINEATQIYVLAAQILGPRPPRITARNKPEVQTYYTLEPKLHLDDFSDPLVAIEGLVAAPAQQGVVLNDKHVPVSLPTMLYFCIPPNETLLGYWDIVADRLFKIRHCMNIEGTVRQLALFEPPIDPALLVKAAAAGVDLSSALSDMSAPAPHYRFTLMLQKATELCAEVKALGSALLSALEKRDAEALTLLRTKHEIDVLRAARQVKEQQVEESTHSLAGLRSSRAITAYRHKHYQSIAFLNTSEQAQISQMAGGLSLQEAAAGVDLIANIVHLIPDFKIGSPTTIGATLGGTNIGNAIKAFSAYLSAQASILSASSSLSGTFGSYMRRWDDWKLQEQLAGRELQQIDKQIAAAEVRLAIAKQEVSNHDLQAENALRVDAFMHEKFTNQDLYDWMISQIAAIYFQSYQLAYEVAKRAERAYRFELGLDDSNFIQFGYWDSLKKGLLSGERLLHDLKRMEMSYLDTNRREYEISRHVSVAMLNPLSLMELKQNGRCIVDLPEALFDMDHPGHYMRRIKSVSISIPSVVGPFISVNCKLTLVKNSLRKKAHTGGTYGRTGSEDPRFMENVGSVQSIVTSNAQNDSGLFEPNLRDERYLPFEGAGAISTWQLELDHASNHFDPATITDVILHLRYTAREGGEAAKAAAKAALPLAGMRLFSLKHEMPTDWYQFLNTPVPATGDHVHAFALNQATYPYHLQGKNIKIRKAHIFIKAKGASLAPFTLYLTPAGAAPNDATDQVVLEADEHFGQMLHKQKSYSAGQEKAPGNWQLSIRAGDLAAPAAAIDDLLLLFEYSAT